jgi:hypothetical protein
VTATPKGLRVLWASLEGKANDGERVCQVVDSRKPATFEQESSEGNAHNGQRTRTGAASRKPATFEQEILEGKASKCQRIRRAMFPRNLLPSTDAICVYTAQVYKARVKQQPGNARYDTDSKVIRIDNCASYSISFDKDDFVTPLKSVKQKVKGLGGVLDGATTRKRAI